jgi:hypothetical protein
MATEGPAEVLHDRRTEREALGRLFDGVWPDERAATSDELDGASSLTRCLQKIAPSKVPSAG